VKETRVLTPVAKLWNKDRAAAKGLKWPEWVLKADEGCRKVFVIAADPWFSFIKRLQAK